MVVIAASTGGPAAVMRVVSGLPKDLPAAVLLVLHMPAAFTQPFTAQLAEVSQLPVKEAEQNETCSLARFIFALARTTCACRLPESSTSIQATGSTGIVLARTWPWNRWRRIRGRATVAVVLTGMGNDAAKGVKFAKAAGGYVIAQDEATSMIFGMPAEAIKTGAVDEVLPLDEISAAIEKRVMQISRLVPAGAR